MTQRVGGLQSIRRPANPALDSRPRGLGFRTSDLGAWGLLIWVWVGAWDFCVMYFHWLWFRVCLVVWYCLRAGCYELAMWCAMWEVCLFLWFLAYSALCYGACAKFRAVAIWYNVSNVFFCSELCARCYVLAMWYAMWEMCLRLWFRECSALCYGLRARCYTLCSMWGMCILAFVLVAFCDVGLDARRFLKWHLFMLHRFYKFVLRFASGAWLVRRGLDALGHGPGRGYGEVTLSLGAREQDN